jgi:hypothetical protein
MLVAAKPLLGRAMFCVDNVDMKMTAPVLEQFVKSLSVRVIQCNETKPRRTYPERQMNKPVDRKAFFLCINKADTKLLLNAEKWPADISISTWYFASKKPDLAAPAAAMATESPTAAAAATASAASRSDDADRIKEVAEEAGDVEYFDDAMNMSPIAADGHDDRSDEQNSAELQSALSSIVLVVDLSAAVIKANNG